MRSIDINAGICENIILQETSIDAVYWIYCVYTEAMEKLGCHTQILDPCDVFGITGWGEEGLGTAPYSPSVPPAAAAALPAPPGTRASWGRVGYSFRVREPPRGRTWNIPASADRMS